MQMLVPEHFKQYGRYLTPELIDELGVPMCNKSLEPGAEYTLVDMDNHVILGALIHDHMCKYPESPLVQIYTQILQSHYTKDNVPAGKIIKIVRCDKIVDEWIGLYPLIAVRFIRDLKENGWPWYWYINKTDKLRSLHPFVQYLYIEHATAIVDNELS